jgi:phosphonate transport system substrate-binding protein
VAYPLGITDELRFVSLAADSAAAFWSAFARALAGRLATRVRVVDDVPWQVREHMLYRGEAHIGVVCGLQYVLAQDVLGAQPGVDVFAAPVMRGARYQDRPIYFSDVVVRRDSRARRLSDLRGACWAINEPTSQSGFNITRFTLASQGETSAFFGRVIESGAHERSLSLLLDGAIDATAIDCTVLDALIRRQPSLHAQIRVIETLGPSPIPPLVISRAVPRPIWAALEDAVLDLHRDVGANEVLELGQMARFVRVEDADYDPIREMARVANRLPSWDVESVSAARMAGANKKI